MSNKNNNNISKRFDHSIGVIYKACGITQQRAGELIDFLANACDGLKPSPSKTIELVSKMNIDLVEKLWLVHYTTVAIVEESFYAQIGKDMFKSGAFGHSDPVPTLPAGAIPIPVNSKNMKKIMKLLRELDTKSMEEDKHSDKDREIT